jgi:predicted hotdog family 3-hydroxylacyl-ACP dehydratase
MEHKEALLESLAELRTAHDKASRAMAEIAATGARALKGSDSLPSLNQLRSYAQALAQAQRHLNHCQELLQGRPAVGMGADLSAGRSFAH